MSSVTRAVRGMSVACVVVLAGCTGGQVQPTGYGDADATEDHSFYANFMYGCTGVEANSAGEFVEPTLESEDYCRCLFEGLKERVPFSVTSDFEERQADTDAGESIEVPRQIQEVMDDCAEDAPARS